MSIMHKVFDAWGNFSRGNITNLLCVGRSKSQAGMQLKCIPGKRDATEMYPGKVMHVIGG